MPRLVATDVDGTLLGADEDPSERTCRVLGRMADAGVPLVLATGRPPRWLPRVCAAVDVQGLCVTANGAVLYDAAADRVLEAVTVSGAALTEVIAGLREALPGCGLAVERVGLGAHDAVDEQFVSEAAYRHAWPNPDDRRVDPAELAVRPVIKVLARHPGMGSDEMAAAARARVGGLVDVTYSASSGLIECSAPGVTKASGLATVAARLGVDPVDVVAFGDMPNDLDMLAWAGHGVAVANAHPAVLAAADEVVGSNLDDGVASVLERWF
jgi:Cof subfamily protein (haloacid dehalogenase superfamily)